jgi:ATP/maltotriose-dependent transcriptional regulator MalT
VLRGTALSLQAYALFCTGDLHTALTSAIEAEGLQSERDDRMRATTLLRRSVILDAMGRDEQALNDARAAQEIAELHGRKAVLVVAALWEKLFLARRGKATPEELRAALANAEAWGDFRRELTRRLIAQAAAWFASTNATITL